MCERIAHYTRGKHKVTYLPMKENHGDTCVVVNVSKILVTGKKPVTKRIKYHSGYVGGLKDIPYRTFLELYPERLVKLIVEINILKKFF